jgi:hypothetical protein
MSRVRADISTLRPLLHNHLTFISTHRGRVRFREGAIDVEGDRDFLSHWIPTEENARMPRTVHTVRIVPWSGQEWPERLRRAGLEPAEVLLYMEQPLHPDLPADASDEVIEVIEVTNPTDALAFAHVQCDGFLDRDDPHNTWWRATFERMARKNHNDPNQFFYLGRAEGTPAAVTLVVRTEELYGVYAVATRPEFRRRGFAPHCWPALDSTPSNAAAGASPCRSSKARTPSGSIAP